MQPKPVSEAERLRNLTLQRAEMERNDPSLIRQSRGVHKNLCREIRKLVNARIGRNA